MRRTPVATMAASSSRRCSGVRLLGSVGSKGTAIGAPSVEDSMPATTFAMRPGSCLADHAVGTKTDLLTGIYRDQAWNGCSPLLGSTFSSWKAAVTGAILQ